MPGAAPDTRATACHGLGVVAYAQKNVREARQHYSRAIELQPTLAAAYRNRGLTWAAEVPPDYERALADARRALELIPAFDDARRDVERSEQASKQQQLNRTSKDSRRDSDERALARQNQNRLNRKRKRNKS